MSKQGKDVYTHYQNLSRRSYLLSFQQRRPKGRYSEIQRSWRDGLPPALGDYHGFNNRTLVQITMDDASQADEIFTILMGDKVPPRKKFIEDNAKYAEIDI